MKKALLCIGNEIRGDDGVAIVVGRLVEENLPEWKVFFGYDEPEDEMESLKEFNPDVIVVIDAISGSVEGEIDFLDLSEKNTYVYRTHDIPNPTLLNSIRDICGKTIFIGICVLLENVLHFTEGLSDNAKKYTIDAFDRIKDLDVKIDK
ncbi:MAG: hydrogenase 3 maturation protease [Sulfurimonas sp.]|jgi:hydrogenase 3 maturation protease